mmetsp:Transcript_18659/g.30437  ORF Transcript_18659/g.30437 Transcript_18659/m.30437 type:complete len:83 (-) Transcript_18659:102-350(-)
MHCSTLVHASFINIPHSPTSRFARAVDGFLVLVQDPLLWLSPTIVLSKQYALSITPHLSPLVLVPLVRFLFHLNVALHEQIG